MKRTIAFFGLCVTAVALRAGIVVDYELAQPLGPITTLLDTSGVANLPLTITGPGSATLKGNLDIGGDNGVVFSGGAYAKSQASEFLQGSSFYLRPFVSIPPSQSGTLLEIGGLVKLRIENTGYSNVTIGGLTYSGTQTFDYEAAGSGYVVADYAPTRTLTLQIGGPKQIIQLPATVSVGSSTGVLSLGAGVDGSSPCNCTIVAAYVRDDDDVHIPTLQSVVHTSTFEPVPMASGTWAAAFVQGVPSGVVTTSDWTSLFLPGNAVLPTPVAGTSVRVNGVTAPVSFAADGGQVNFLVPDNLAVEGAANQVIVTTPIGSATTSFVTAASSGGGFPLSISGKKMYPVVLAADGHLIGPVGVLKGATTSPANSGDSVVVYFSGGGQTNPATITANLPSEYDPLKAL